MNEIDDSPRKNYLFHAALSNLLHSGKFSLSQVPSAIRIAIEKRVWEDLYIPVTRQNIRFSSIQEWIEADMPEGLKSDTKTIELLIQEDTDLLLQFKALVSTAKGKSDTAKLKPRARGRFTTSYAVTCGETPSGGQRGNSKDYLISRLKQIDPSLITEIGKGKRFASLAAAAVYAGIIKLKQRLEIRENPEEMAKQILSKCGKDYAKALAIALNNNFSQSKQKTR